MLCTKCGRNQAVFHSVISINGIEKEEHLCNECYNHKSNRFSHFIEDCFLSPFDAFDMLLPIDYMVDVGRQQIVNNYNTFDRNVNYYANYKNIIQEAKNSVKKGADKICEERMKKPNFDIIQQLRQELAYAVEVEDYEKAGEIKKKIDKLSKENNDAK